MSLVLIHVAAADAVAVLRAQYLQVEALAVHLQALGLLAVAADLLHLLYLVQPVPLLRAAAHLPPRPPLLHLLRLQPQLTHRQFLEFLHFGELGAEAEGRVPLGVLAGGEGGDGGVAGRQLAAGAGGVQNFLGGKCELVERKFLVGFFLYPVFLLLHPIIFHEWVVLSGQVIFNNGSPLELLEHLVLEEIAPGCEVEDGQRALFLLHWRVSLHDLLMVE